MQRLPARLVTTPQTVHSFTRESSTGWLARSTRLRCYACGTVSVGREQPYGYEVQAYQAVAAFHPSPTTIRNLSYSPE